MSGARAMFAGPGARRALLDGARGQVEIVLQGGGGYVRLGSSGWVLLTRPGAPFGPLSVAVDGLHRLELRPGALAEVTRGRLLVGGRALSLERMRDRASAAADRACSASCASLPPPPVSLEAGIGALAAGRLTEAVRLLAGLGQGLTPAGDDVLAGYAAARLALGSPVAPALSTRAFGRSSPIGLAYLRCAERGELPDAPLRSWGASSGIAIGWGINAAVLQLSGEGQSRGVGSCQVSGWASMSSRMRRSSTSPRLTASGRWRAATTRSSTRS